ncbi:NAD(P)H-dependent flavin oxidoreductase [Peribacillus sp. NPDC096540]|uniref:NAD(P)H-dependent flavin oxidoreductase n=1 Tax=Peribacillus sp. NPDC096540 TaxID=3390612 RepID=UPI003D024347
MKRICEFFSIKYPIIQGGMGNISNASLAAAVSNAGGLGTIGCGTMNPEQVEAIILATKEKTNNTFALNIPINVSPYTDELINLVFKHDIPIVSLSAGNPAPFIPLLHKKNIKVIAIVASVKHAQKAQVAGADVLVAEGFEAAGINSNLELTTFTLIPQISKNVTVPVLAAGGIGNGQGLAAALMLGASGVQLGTRLIATKEAPFHPSYKQKLLEAFDNDTCILGRSVGQVRRVLKDPYTVKVLELEKKGLLPVDYREMTSEEHHINGAINGDVKNGFMNSGQVAGLIDDIPTVKELLDGMMNDAKKQMEDRLNSLSMTFTQM